MPSDEDIAMAAQLACVLEVSAPKPGNVNRLHDFPDARLEDFLASAIAVGNAMRAARRLSVGETIWRAVCDTRRWVKTNTNLGMILLLAPLVKACTVDNWRAQLRRVLEELTVEDARLAYRAIRLAVPGGMGQVNQGDITDEPNLTLRAAMELARERDTVAREYCTDFEITFELTYPTLRSQRASGLELADAIVQTFLRLLSEVPDTLIARKNSSAVAEEVSHEAGIVLQNGGVCTPAGRSKLEEFDLALRRDGHRLNPGTSADLITAALFLYLIEQTGWSD